jgi:hypothetical protein
MKKTLTFAAAVNHRYPCQPGVDRWLARALPVPTCLRTLALIAALTLTIPFGVRAQVNHPPDPPTPQQAYEQLLSVGRFAFGGVGYAGVTSEGEKAYRAIAAGTNALAVFCAVLTNGNAQAKLYALCGIRQFAPRIFEAQSKPLLIANPQVETMSGCLVSHEFASNVVARIASGSYDAYFKKRKR